MPSYRGFEYSIHSISGGHHWRWVASTSTKELTGVVRGTKESAIEAAQSAIDRWLRNNPNDANKADK